jgi:hypothetical protein
MGDESCIFFRATGAALDPEGETKERKSDPPAAKWERLS